VIALGKPAATSRANEGPVITAAGRPGSRSATSSWRKRPVPGSKPLLAQAIAVCADNRGTIAARVSAKAWLGTTISTMSACATASARSAS